MLKKSTNINYNELNTNFNLMEISLKNHEKQAAYLRVHCGSMCDDDQDKANAPIVLYHNSSQLCSLVYQSFK